MQKSACTSLSMNGTNGAQPQFMLKVLPYGSHHCTRNWSEEGAAKTVLKSFLEERIAVVAHPLHKTPVHATSGVGIIPLNRHPNERKCAEAGSSVRPALNASGMRALAIVLDG